MAYYKGSPELYRAVRIKFLERDETLTGWCRDHCIRQPTARAALLGHLDGPKGRRLRNRIVKAVGLSS